MVFATAQNERPHIVTVGLMLTLLLLAAPFGLVACSLSQGSGGSAATDAQTTDGDASEQPAEPVDWPDECTDRRGDITCYAVAELEGAQLSALLLEQDYVWSERNHMWVKEDGSSSVTVLSSEGEALTSAQVEELATGAESADVSYRLVTSGYSSAKRAFSALGGNVMTCDDSEFADESGVAVVSSTSGERMLVFVSTSNDTHVLTVFSSGAIEAGLLDKLAGRELGGSVEEAFATLTGREPQVAEPRQ